jgi:hypothetical protein
MSLKKKLHPLAHKPFGGSVELAPQQPLFTEFIDTHRLWGFPRHQLQYFMLEERKEHQNQKTTPPHHLALVYRDATVILHGWRLELMVGPLVNGTVARVHAEKHLGNLILEEAWVSEIQVTLYGKENPPV